MKLGKLFQFPNLGFALIGVSGIKAITQFLIFSFVSAIGGLSQAGYLALAYAITGPVFVLVSMGLRTLILTHKQHFGMNSVEIVRVWTNIVALAICALLALAISPNAFLITFAISLTKIPESFGEIYASYMQKIANIPKMTYPQIAVILAGSLAFLLGFTISHNLMYAALGSFCISGIIQFFVARRISFLELQKYNFDSPRLSKYELFHQGMPSGISDGVLSLSVNIPTLALAFFFSSEIVAVFSFGLYIVSGLELILNAISQGWIPKAKLLLKQSELNVASTMKQGAKWLPLIFFTAILAYFVLELFFIYFQPENSKSISIPIWPILLISLVEPFMFASSTSINVLNRYKLGMTGSFISLFVVGITAIVLVPRFELVGAYLSVVVLVVSRLLINLIFIGKKY